MALLLAKGEDFASWHGVEEYSVAYREAAVKLASIRHPEGISQMLEVMEDLISAVEHENSLIIEGFKALEKKLADVSTHTELRTILGNFYEQAYRHFDLFGSPAAFFCMAETFQRSLAGCCLRLAMQQIGKDLPPVAFFIMGPAGRGESTRYCRMQLALVWNGTAPEQLMQQLGEELVAWLRVCGIAFEESVTPANEIWRGSLEQWSERFESALQTRDKTFLIELLRFSDRSLLVGDEAVATGFSGVCSKFLSDRKFIGNLVDRSHALSNGINMMGGLKLEKSGPHRGAFSLLDHAFLPLASAIAVFCLINGIELSGTPQRLRALVRSGRLDVDLAERTLHAWHCFSEHRLTLELHATQGQDCRDILHLIPASLGSDELERLRSSLETVADLQRHMMVAFGAYT